VDKLLFKKLCARMGLPVPRNIRVLARPRELAAIYGELPGSFVVKSNKGCARYVVVHDKTKTTPKCILSKLANWAADHPDPQYNFTRPKLYVEQYLGRDPADIKVVVHKGKPTILWVDVARHGKHRKCVCSVSSTGKVQVRPSWRWTEGKAMRGRPKVLRRLQATGQMKRVLHLARRLARKVGLPLVRADFYFVGGRVLGGELTLTSARFGAAISRAAARWAVGKKAAGGRRRQHRRRRRQRRR